MMCFPYLNMNTRKVLRVTNGGDDKKVITFKLIMIKTRITLDFKEFKKAF